MSHQPKVISNSNNAKTKKDDSNSNNNTHNNNREVNLSQLNKINNKSNKRLNANLNYNILNNSINLNNFITYYDKKYSEEENEFLISSVFTFGSNEMGQIGCDFDSKDSNTYSPYPIYLSELTKKRITSISAGDGHSVCVGKDGTVYAWGASACGKLFKFFKLNYQIF